METAQISQTPAPNYKLIAEQIANLAQALTSLNAEQGTIRTALDAFSRACQSHPGAER